VLWIIGPFFCVTYEKMVMFHRDVELPEGKTGPRSAVCQRANPKQRHHVFFCCGATVIAAVSVLPFFDVRQYLHISGSTAN